MIATTRAALIRGEGTDDLGDEIPTVDTVDGFEDFPISIIERNTHEFDPDSNTWRSVRYYAGRLSPRVPVQPGDRIRDNRDGAIYALDGFTRTARSLSGRSSVTIKLRRTTP